MRIIDTYGYLSQLVLNNISIYVRINETSERHLSSTITYCKNTKGVLFAFAFAFFDCLYLLFFMVMLCSTQSPNPNCLYPEFLILYQPIWPNIPAPYFVKMNHMEIATDEWS